MKRSKEIRSALKAWESWVDPVSDALEDLAALESVLRSNNSVSIDTKELRKLHRQFEQVMVRAWGVSNLLGFLDRRIQWAKEDAKKESQ